MPSKYDDYSESVTVSIVEAVTVVNRKRLKEEKLTYTNLQCNNCQEWWLMLCLGDRKKVRCPWCGAKCKTKRIKNAKNEC